MDLPIRPYYAGKKRGDWAQYRPSHSHYKSGKLSADKRSIIAFCSLHEVLANETRLLTDIGLLLA